MAQSRITLRSIRATYYLLPLQRYLALIWTGSFKMISVRPW